MAQRAMSPLRDEPLVDDRGYATLSAQVFLESLDTLLFDVTESDEANSIESDNASSKSNQALATLSRIADILDLLKLAPSRSNHFSTLDDSGISNPSDGDFMQYDSASGKWINLDINGYASGSFTTVDSKTVTVVNGIITNIV
jgi:hypothetical protein